MTTKERLKKLAERLSYEFDRTMSAGPIALIGWLAVATTIVIVTVAAFLALTRISQDGGKPLGFVEASWEALMRTIDSGTLGGDVGWDFRLVMLLVTLWGIFVVSALIGLLSAGVQNKLDDLRKGRSVILEADHTIILNWSTSIFDIITELCVAHARTPKFRIVIMASNDKVEMEDAIAAKVKLPRNVQVICRSGDPTDLYDLTIVNLAACKSIIVLSPETDDPDSQVIKTILAIVHDPRRREARHRIAAEFREARNAEIAQRVGGAELQIVMADDLISRIIVHTSRQSGLSGVYSELLDFEGCEIYTAPQPNLAGKTFGEALIAFDTSALIGVCDPAGNVRLNPAMSFLIEDGAQVILIAEDRESIAPADPTGRVIQWELVRDQAPATRAPERILVLDWNRRGQTIACELTRFMAPGSTLVIAANTDSFEQDFALLNTPGVGVEVKNVVCDTSRHTVLEQLDIPSFDHVIVLAHGDSAVPHAADTRTLVTLLHLRHIADASGKHISVVSEMTDIRNRELAEVTRADDFVVSNKLVSLMLAQVSENEHLAAIFKDLLDEEGSEIYMRPAEDYVALDQPISFFTIIEAARRRGETAFGYCRRRADQADARKLGGVVLNPKKSEMQTYSAGDLIIVLAQ